MLLDHGLVVDVVKTAKSSMTDTCCFREFEGMGNQWRSETRSVDENCKAVDERKRMHTNEVCRKACGCLRLCKISLRGPSLKTRSIEILQTSPQDKTPLSRMIAAPRLVARTV